jgi:hypothetical protein
MDAVQGGLAHGLINAQPKADLYEPPNVRFWGNSGQRWILARDGLVANDPTATFATHCGNGFDASLSPYQRARLSRYNAAS